jgi:HSP20 family molecular chaperone IbpA
LRIFQKILALETSMDEFATNLLKEINELRTNPRAFGERALKPLLSHFDGLYYTPPGQTRLKTVEGVSAVREAYDYCCGEAQSAPAIERVSVGLGKSAMDLVRENGPLGVVDNLLPDGTTVGERLARYGRWSGKASEAIAFGKNPPLDAVLQWLVDDGNRNRTQRATLMEPRYSVVGIGHGPHAKYHRMVAVVFAQDYAEGADASELRYQTRTTAVTPATGEYGTNGGGAASSSAAAAALPAAANNASVERVGDLGVATDGRRVAAVDTVRSKNASESVLAEQSGKFVLDSGDLRGASRDQLTLALDARHLTLTIKTESDDTVRTRTLKWELPFAPAPRDVNATFANGALRVLVDKPRQSDALSSASSAAAGNVVATFSLAAASSGAPDERMDVRVQQTDDAFVCAPIASAYIEQVEVQHTGGDQLKFICSHEEKENDPDGVPVTKQVTLTRTIKLPYAVASDAIHFDATTLSIRVLKIQTSAGALRSQSNIVIH